MSMLGSNTSVSFVSLSEKYTTRYYTQYGFCTRVQKYTPRICFSILVGYFCDTHVASRYYTLVFSCGCLKNVLHPSIDFAPALENILPGYLFDTFWILFRCYSQHLFCTRVQTYTPRILFGYFFDTTRSIDSASASAVTVLSFGAFQPFRKAGTLSLQCSSLSEGWNIYFCCVPAFRKAGAFSFTVIQPFRKAGTPT